MKFFDRRFPERRASFGHQKRLKRRFAGGFPYGNDRRLGHQVVFENELFNLARIDVDAADDFYVVRAAPVSYPSVGVDAHPVPRVEPAIADRRRLGRSIPIAGGQRRSADPKVSLNPGCGGGAIRCHHTYLVGGQNLS